MYVYVIRPEGVKYDVCENGTMIEDGSGLCMTYSGNMTIDLLNTTTNLSVDLGSTLFDSESSSVTQSPLDGKFLTSLDISN